MLYVPVCFNVSSFASGCTQSLSSRAACKTGDQTACAGRSSACTGHLHKTLHVVTSQAECMIVRAYLMLQVCRYVYEYANGRVDIFALYFVPISPGVTRSFFKFVSKDAPKGFGLISKVPQWLFHNLSGTMSDQDSVMLHTQVFAPADPCFPDCVSMLLQDTVAPAIFKLLRSIVADRNDSLPLAFSALVGCL